MLRIRPWDSISEDLFDLEKVEWNIDLNKLNEIKKVHLITHLN